MAILRPFKAIRPTKEFVSKVAALPYDVVNSEEARKIVDDEPYSFLKVDRPEVDLNPDINIYDEKVYKKASENLQKLIENNCEEDGKPNLYLYKLVMGERSQIGIVGCSSIDDYNNNIIKKHELTREEKEKDRINHVDYCDANTGPIFLTYRSSDIVNAIINKWINNNQPIYDFAKEDDVQHTVWKIDDEDVINTLSKEFANISYVYIADGHHRAASAVKVGMKRRQQNPQYTGEEEFNYFLSVLFADEQLHIMDYNRVVKDLNGLTKEEFLEKVAVRFNIECLGKDKPYKPSATHQFGMFVDNEWYKLTAKECSYDANDVIAKLDVSILQENLLNPLLGIDDPRTDKRIDFVGGIRGLKELERRVNDDMKIAFSMYPTSIKELMDIADNDKVMPPKSTWFEPKLRSGIFIHKL